MEEAQSGPISPKARKPCFSQGESTDTRSALVSTQGPVCAASTSGVTACFPGGRVICHRGQETDRTGGSVIQSSTVLSKRPSPNGSTKKES